MSPKASNRRPTVAPTGWRDLFTAALAGGLAGWLLVRAADALDRTPPQVPWTAPVALVLAALFVAYLARVARRIIQGDIRSDSTITPEYARTAMEPERVVFMILLGKSAALAGVAVAAGYAGFAINFVNRMAVAEPQMRVIRSAVAIVASIGLALAGLALERAYRIPVRQRSDDEPDSDTP